MRYVFSNSLSWSEELARYIFLWQIWLGASYGVKTHRHIRIEIIKEKISTKANIILEIIITIICITFTIFLLLKGAQMTEKVFRLNQLTAALRWPMGYPYLSVPVGAGLMTIRYIERLFFSFKEIKEITN
jgi:TRAP-type C4-dicarboxylate transport system permease small subunit